MATVLIGFMGAGKSTCARALSDTAIDTDQLLADELGMTIAEFFEQAGEERFRERESALVTAVLERSADDAVVALGGGAVTNPGVAGALERHSVYWLDVDPATAHARVSGSRELRPLARDRQHFDRLHAERTPVYASLADAVLPVGADVPAAHAAFVRAAPPPGTRMTWSPAGQYPVFVGRGILGIEAGPADGRRYVITDETVGELYTGLLRGAAGSIEIPPGERHKTLRTAERAWAALADQGATRADHIAALGGGVVGDLGGFVAHAYQRGIPVVQIPTTVVAMVDSALGGKTGVDLPAAKNYVGAYHQPAAVVADTTTLQTLPPEEHAAGYAEVVKTALIAGGELWDRVAAGEPVDDDIVLRCARAKLAVVAADERDGGLRQVLNLGHTVGHALETVTGYTALRHGEAVSIGLLVALRLSGQNDLREQVAALLSQAGLPTAYAGADPEAVIAATRRDKKRLGDKVPFVLIRAPGDVVFGQDVEDSELRAAVSEIITG